MRYARRAARGLTLFGTSYNWTGATWALDGGGRALNVPTLGSELLTNVEFTSNTLGWTAANGATLTWRDFASSPAIAPSGGADNGGIQVQSNGVSSSAARQVPTVIVGGWYTAFLRAYAPSGNVGTNVAALQSPQPVGTTKLITSEDVWQSLVQTARATSTTGDFRLRCNSVTAGDSAYFDAPSLKEISTATTFATVIGASATLTAAAKIAALTTGTQAGVVALLDSAASPANFLIGYHNGTNVVLDKSVGGTYTNLISTAVAFSADAQIEIRRPSGNTFQLWYGGTQRGTNQTVSDAGIISNTRYGLFSTYSGNTVSEFSLGGASIPFSLPGA